MSTEDTEALLVVFYLGLIPACLLLYAIPAIVAFRRRHPNRYAILVINFAFGGTGIGWLGALVWALGAVHLTNEAVGSNGGESGLNLFTNDRDIRLPGSGGALTASAPIQLTTAAAVAEIERLGRLRAAGDLTEAEFAALKAGILDRL